MDAQEGLGATLVNLIGPAAGEAKGDWFMSTEFLAAFQQKNLYLRIFGNSLPIEGEAIPFE